MPARRTRSLWRTPRFCDTYHPGTSFLHRVPASVKLTAISLLAVFLFVISDIRACLVVFLFMMFLTAVSRMPLTAVYSQMKRYAVLAATAFLLPVFFHSGADVIADIGVLKITAERPSSGDAFCLAYFIAAFCKLSSDENHLPRRNDPRFVPGTFPLRLPGLFPASGGHGSYPCMGGYPRCLGSDPERDGDCGF